MRSWLPRFYRQGACLSDDLGEDAEGTLFGVEFVGFVVEVALYRRGRRA